MIPDSCEETEAKLIMNSRDVRRLQDHQRADHDRDQICRSLSPERQIERPWFYRSFSSEREYHERSYSSKGDHYRRSEFYPPRSLLGDRCHGSKFSPSHSSPEADNERCQHDHLCYSKRGHKEVSEFCNSLPFDTERYEKPLPSQSNPPQRKHCRNPRPRFVPNLPSRPRQRAGSSRMVPVLPTNIPCTDGKINNEGRQREENGSSMTSADQRNKACTDKSADKMCTKEKILFFEDRDSLVAHEHTLPTSTENTFQKFVEAKTQQTGTIMLGNLPMNAMNGQMTQASHREVLPQPSKSAEDIYDKVISTKHQLQLSPRSGTLSESIVEPSGDALLNSVLGHDCTDSRISATSGADLTPEDRQEHSDSSLLPIPQQEHIPVVNVGRPSAMENISAFMVKQSPKTWIRNGGHETFCRSATLPITQEQFYRPRQRGAMRGQFGRFQEFQKEEVPCDLRYPYESQQLRVLSAIQNSKSAFLDICSELESAVQADQRMYHQIHKELDISFFEVKSAKEAVLKEKLDMEEVKSRALEDPLAMSRQITTMKEARGVLEHINTDLSVQLAELNQLQEQLEEQQRILEVLIKLRPDKGSCNDEEEEFLLTKREECKAKLSSIESELNESRKTTNKLEQLSLKRLKGLNEVIAHTSEGSRSVQPRIRETRHLKRQSSSEEQIVQMKQPKLEYES